MLRSVALRTVALVAVLAPLAACGDGDGDVAAQTPPGVDREELADDLEGETPALDEAHESTVEPVWSRTGVGGSIRVVAADGSVGYMASNLERGGAIFAIELATGDLIWEIESEVAFDLLVPDGDGGLIAAGGTTVVAFDDRGRTTWEAVPLRRTEGVPAGTVQQIAVDGDLVVVGGSAPSGAAGLDRATGEGRWHLPADEALAAEPIGFGGAADLVAFTDEGLLVSGGVPRNRHLALLDLSSDPPEVRWTLPDVGANVRTDGRVVVDAVGDTVTAWDLATGKERWSVTEEAWGRAPVGGHPAIVDDLVIVQRANSSIAFDLATGDRVWEDATLPAYWGFIGSDVRYGNQVFGQRSTIEYALLGPDGSVTEILLATDIRGTVSSAAIADGKVLLAAAGSTAAQGSTVFVLDLTDIG